MVNGNLGGHFDTGCKFAMGEFNNINNTYEINIRNLDFMPDLVVVEYKGKNYGSVVIPKYRERAVMCDVANTGASTNFITVEGGTPPPYEDRVYLYYNGFKTRITAYTDSPGNSIIGKWYAISWVV